jgi:transcriptional regulator with PAS, ATPase and Fis domain
MGETPSPPPAAERTHEPSGSWSSLFQHSADPVFLLSRRRQIRYVNRSWESLTGKPAEAVRGLYCLPRKKKGPLPLRALLQALAPSPEVMGSRPTTIRRPAPPARLGPPWWDVTFLPLRDANGLTGIIGFIKVVGTAGETPHGTGLSEALVALRQQTAAHYSFDLLQSDSPAMQRVQAQARLAATTKAPVWITGEAGTGKETLARVVHFQGVARDQTFLALECSCLQPFLIRNMLFGHAGQAGPRLGAIYLKEPALLPRDLQTEILEWVEEQDDPPRIVVGSRDLNGDDLRAGRLTAEFHSTFNVLEIRLPALRDRLDDLPRLAQAFLRQEFSESQVVPEIAPAALDLMLRHQWSGNLRELRILLSEALTASAGNAIQPGHLPLELRAPPAKPAAKAAPALDAVLEQMERNMIRLALRKSKGNSTKAAGRLGISRTRLLRRIEALKIDGTSN